MKFGFAGRWGVVLLVGLGAGGAIVRSLPRYLLPAEPAFRGARLPHTVIESGRVGLRLDGRWLVGEVGRYQDELFAYLMFRYLRSRPALRDLEVWLSYAEEQGQIVYRIRVKLPEEMSAGIGRLYELAAEFPFLGGDYLVLGERGIAAQRRDTATFISAYSFAKYRRLEDLAERDVVAYARRFIRFKSATDPRIQRQIEPVPKRLTKEDAESLAQDIVSVAKFYAVPLDFFLGIGAMENNFMNVRGDLNHSIWKRRAQKGDIVLKRTADRVLVLNQARGVWQITQETLRYAHELFLRDRRDYRTLAEHLRPARTLDLDHLDTRVLTTYAGLLFRDLLDRFGGDVQTAVGAYNGGPGKPNPRYAEGVTMVADYARTVMEQAASLRGHRVVDLELLTAK